MVDDVCGRCAALPKSMVTHNLYAYALLGAGRYEEALGEFEAYVRVAPREPNPFDSLGEAYIVMGAPDRAVESYSRALTIDPTFAGSHIGRAWSLASLGRYDDAILERPPQSLLASWSSVRALVLSRVGRYREADQAIEAGRREAEISENAGEQGNLFLVSSLLAIERAAYERALQDCRSAERMFASLPEKKRRVGLVLVHLMSGIAQARAGRIDQARLHLEMQGRLFNSAVEPENWWHNALAGEIALAAGDLEKAASAFSAGQPSRKDVVQHPPCELGDSGEQCDFARWTRARRSGARGPHPRDSDLSPTVVLWARPEMGVGVRAAICARDRPVARAVGK